MSNKNKKGFEMAISMLVVIVLGVVLLIALALAFTGGWKKFIRTTESYSMSDIDALAKICRSQCDMANSQTFCCQERELGGEKEKITCQDERLKVECGINCGEVCSS
ncbi:hypothetical protein HYW76_01860 [Candidatus Pacearchaeota archaeon]|nr:hypothetical protein [Candidatus Pacearchaeota archaeon]